MIKVLILEDEETLGQIYKKKIEENSYDVLWTKTSQETKEAVKSFKADILLIDHGIKGEGRSGISIIPFLRKELPQSKIIVLSNYSKFQFEEEAFKAGADDFLVKINTPPNILLNYLKNLH